MRFLFPTLRHERTFLTPCAQHSRRHPTPSERILWEALRKRQLGVKVRRQVILANTIVDFYVPEAKLAIEVDGGAHRGREAYDAQRDKYLAVHGVRTLRVKAWRVERRLHEVLATLRDALAVSVRPIVSPGRAKTAFQHAGAVAGERQRDQAESRG
jgi:very-short-patch-repair endonuclease